MNAECYWSVIKANISDAGRPQEAAISEWWTRHSSEFASRDGFHRCWRLHTVHVDGEIGDFGHEYAAVYEIDGVDVFTLALGEDGPAWGPFHDYIGEWVIGWGRTYYRLLTTFNEDDDAGQYWAIVKAQPRFESGEQDREFNDWYSTKHVPEMCAHQGFHRAWRLSVFHHPNELGPAPHRYWAIYQIDSPTHFTEALKKRYEGGAKPWDGVWLQHLEEWGISFHEIIHRDTHELAQARLAHKAANE